MKFKKIMLVTLILLTILTMSAVSAFDDADSLTDDATGDEDVIQTPDENEKLEIAPEDFNVEINQNEININNDSAVVISFDWPENTTSNDYIGVSLNDEGEYNFFKSENNGIITLEKLYIFEPGNYNVSVNYYKNDNKLELANGTLKITKTYTANDFIEIYSKTISDSQDYICIVHDSTGTGLKGLVTLYANETQVFSKNFNTGNNAGVMIYSKNLTSTLNGKYLIKVTYERSNGGIYSKNATINFAQTTAEPTLSPGDFNVNIINRELDYDLDENTVVIDFDWPEGIGVMDCIGVAVQGSYERKFYYAKGETPSRVLLIDLYIRETGNFNITVNYYDMNNNKLELANGTLKIIKTFSDADFLHLYSSVPMDEGEFCKVYDSDSDIGLNGDVSVYIGGNLAYFKQYSGNNKISDPIYCNNLTGSYNGNYNVKVIYNRLVDGKQYIQEKNVQFNNVIGKGTLPNTNTNPTTQTNTPAKTPVTKLTLKTVKVKKSAKKLTIQVTVKVDGKAVSKKKVTFKFNGKKYTAKTNSKGVAKLTIKKAVLKKLKVGKKVKYQATYNKVTVSKSVKVLK